jgi:hypothetical protein
MNNWNLALSSEELQSFVPFVCTYKELITMYLSFLFLALFLNRILVRLISVRVMRLAEVVKVRSTMPPSMSTTSLMNRLDLIYKKFPWVKRI